MYQRISATLFDDIDMMYLAPSSQAILKWYVHTFQVITSHII